MRIDTNKLNLSEKDLEDYIFDNPNIIEVPFTREKITKWIGRQFRIPSGIIDLIGITENHKIVVIELKNVPFSSSHITQVCRYAADIENAYFNYGGMHNLIVKKILISPFEPSVEFITEANAVNVYLLTINIEINFEISGYWRYSEKYKDEYSKKLEELSKTDEINLLITLSQAKFASENEANYGRTKSNKI